MAYLQKEIRSGPMLEVIQYGYRERLRTREKREAPTRKEQAALNEKNARRKANRMILANFTPKDFFATLEYRRKVTPAEAKRQMNNFLRRARDALRKMGKDLKYILVDESGASGDNPHHHIIMTGMSLDLLEELWCKGDDNRYVGAVSRLRFDENGVEGLARYLTKEERPKGARRWTPSRNLIKPDAPENCRIKPIRRPNLFRPPRDRKGYKLVEVEVHDNLYTGAYRYIRYMKL